MTPVTVKQGDGPIILAQPHSGTFVPDEIASNLSDAGRGLIDTDWFIPELYDQLLPNATIVRANFSRYVVDANRAVEDTSLYPGQNTTGLIPLVTFDDQPLWHVSPSEVSKAARVVEYHQPYHHALSSEIERVKQKFGVAVLYDCHSIRSTLPFLFEGQLPELNIGTNDGRSCHPIFRDAAIHCCDVNGRFSYVVNGRFKGGWTTRHYGKPENGVHAVQMEIAQRAYLKSEQAPFELCPKKAEPLRALLRELLEQFSDIALRTNFLEK